jgi:thioredoxin
VSQVVDVDDASFEARVLGAARPVLVDFSATWCAPCRKLEPIVHDLAAEYAGRMDVVHIDVEKAPMVSGRLGVMSVPTLMFFRSGEIVDRLTGVVPKETLREHMDRVLG